MSLIRPSSRPIRVEIDSLAFAAGAGALDSGPSAAHASPGIAQEKTSIAATACARAALLRRVESMTGKMDLH
jgi:hypothetical protein